MIEVRDLRISFGGRTVIDRIDLSVPAEGADLLAALAMTDVATLPVLVPSFDCAFQFMARFYLDSSLSYAYFRSNYP